MTANWKAGGAARVALENSGVAGGLSTILTGMGSLSYGELAGERMKLGLLLGDPEEEHDCFSDNTHNSHRYDAVGIRTAYNRGLHKAGWIGNDRAVSGRSSGCQRPCDRAGACGRS